MEAALREQMGEPIAARIDLAEGVSGALVFERGRVAASEKREVE